MKQSFVILLLSFLSAAGLRAQMLDPSIDKKGEPFCYFSHPTDVIGVMDGREATLVSPEGYLYTGWGELMFFTGYPCEPVNQRVKTLERGYLPIIHYQFEKQQIRYSVAMFARTLDGRPESGLVNFVRVEVRNVSAGKRTAYFGAGVRYEGEATTDWGVADHRFGRPIFAQKPGDFEQLGVAFSRDWEYAFQEGDTGAVTRNDSLLYTFPVKPAPMRFMTFSTGYNERPTVWRGKLWVDSHTPVCIVNYPLSLMPGESKTLDFAMPYIPVPAASEEAKHLREASFDQMHERTIQDWEKILASGMDVRLPEEKAEQAFRANLIYDLIARNKIDSSYIQKVNEFQYDTFWLRDAAFIARMYDLTGYAEFARQCLDFFPRWQKPDGNFQSQEGQNDGWGQTLWAYAEHYRLTRDTAFARMVYPSIPKAVAWLKRVRQADSLKLMPVTTPGDNELITGHVTGHNFWALVGLKGAMTLAGAVGEEADKEEFKKEYDDLSSTLMPMLRRLGEKTGNYIPPGLENTGGSDWDNMSALYPEMLLSKDDPLVSGTLAATRAKYAEGLMTYDSGRYLHHYLTVNNMQTELIRGEEEHVLDEFYALLVHTSATHAGFEFAVLPWSTRDFGMNLSPHGWFAAQFRMLVRTMLVREEAGELHLFSCLSPEWTKSGKEIRVEGAPTYFGTVGVQAAFDARGADVTIKTKWFEQPRNLVLHFPYYVDVASVTCDGKRVPFTEKSVTLPSSAKSVRVNWTKNARAREKNYEQAVRDYKQEYQKRYEDFLKNGKQVY